MIARAIQKIIDGEADAYIGSTGKVFTLVLLDLKAIDVGMVAGVATSVLLVTFNWPEKSERYRSHEGRKEMAAAADDFKALASSNLRSRSNV